MQVVLELLCSCIFLALNSRHFPGATPPPSRNFRLEPHCALGHRLMYRVSFLGALNAFSARRTLRSLRYLQLGKSLLPAETVLTVNTVPRLMSPAGCVTGRKKHRQITYRLFNFVNLDRRKKCKTTFSILKRCHHCYQLTLSTLNTVNRTLVCAGTVNWSEWASSFLTALQHI